ncbi:MAG TPA: hypothetical protein VG435_14415 [Acidimicrobiales bacterium]|jgi:hypothetical protein|nr:hypothetical protein [Acidimicrobiales bacterium]
MNDFDFLVGSWAIANRRRSPYLGEPGEWHEFPSTSTCVRLFDGAGNADSFLFPTLNTAGLTLRLQDVATGEWSLYWASSRDGRLQPPVVGRFADGVGTFLGDDMYEGRPIQVRYIWSDITAVSARWEQSFSIDVGHTWSANWVMSFTRVAQES